MGWYSGGGNIFMCRLVAACCLVTEVPSPWPHRGLQLQALLGDLCQMLNDKEGSEQWGRCSKQPSGSVLQGVFGQYWLPIRKVTLQHGHLPRLGVPEAPGSSPPGAMAFSSQSNLYCVSFYPLHCWGLRSLWRWRIYSCWEVYSFHGSLLLPQPGRKCLTKQGYELGFFINAVLEGGGGGVLWLSGRGQGATSIQSETFGTSLSEWQSCPDSQGQQSEIQAE